MPDQPTINEYTAADKRIIDLEPARAGAPATDFLVPVWDLLLNQTVRRPLAASLGLSSSGLRGGTKYVRFKSSQYNGVQAGDTTLDRLDPATLCVNCEAVVLNPSATPLAASSPSARFVLARVAAGSAGAIEAYVDDAPATTQKVWCAWVEKGTAEGNAAGYEQFDPQKDQYANGATVKHTIAGRLRIFEARQTLTKTQLGGAIPAPTGSSADPYWSEVSGNPLEHQQNTDSGTYRDTFAVGQATIAAGSGALYRGLVITKADGSGLGFLGARIRSDSGAAVFEVVQCVDYVPGRASNSYEPLGASSGGAFPIPAKKFGSEPTRELTSQADYNEYVLRKFSATTSVATPGKPTQPQTDDQGNTFSGLLVPGFSALVEYRAFWPGSGGAVPLTDATAYVQNGRLFLKNIYMPAAVGEVGFGVAPDGSRPPGPYLSNLVAFTSAGAPARGYQLKYESTYPAPA